MRLQHSIFILFALLLAACGQKGPLYLPDAPLAGAAEAEQQDTDTTDTEVPVGIDAPERVETSQ